MSNDIATTATSDKPWTALLLVAVGVGLFLLYAFTASANLLAEDSSIFTLSCLNGDIAHAPGYPLYALLCYPFNWLPWVSPPLAAALFSAAAAALACVVFVGILHRLTDDIMAAVGGGVLFGLSRSFWGQANIPEVYSLNVLLFFIAWWWLLDWRDRPTIQRLVRFVFVCALAMTNHWPLFVLAAGGFVFLGWRQWCWLVRQMRSPLFWAVCLGAVVLGLSPYGYLVWQTHHPVAFLGVPFAPTDWAGFWQIVSRKLLFAIDDQAGVGLSDKRQFMLFLIKQTLFWEVGFVGGVLLLIGFIRQWWTVGIAMSLFLSFVFFSATGGLVMLLHFLYDAKNAQIFSVYPLLSYAAVCVWCVLALRGRWRRWALGIACLLALVINFPVNDRRHDTLTTEIADMYLQTLPENSGLLMSNNLVLLVKTKQYLDATRNDVTVLPVPNPYLLEVLYPGTHLYPPNQLPYEEEVQRINDYVKTRRVCYNTYVPFSDARPSQEHLLFSCLREETAAAVVVDSTVTDFLLRLAEQYPTIDNWQTQEIAGSILHDAARTLLLLQGRLQLPDEWKPLLEALSTSPPGVLAVLEYLTKQPGLTLPIRRADSFEQAVMISIPLVINRRVRVRFFSALGNIYAAVEPRTPETLARALHYHHLAADNIPAADSRGVQQALAFYQREDMSEEIAALRTRYGAALSATNTDIRWE